MDCHTPIFSRIDFDRCVKAISRPSCAGFLKSASCCFSINRIDSPWRAKDCAKTKPVGPAPIIMTSFLLLYFKIGLHQNKTWQAIYESLRIRALIKIKPTTLKKAGNMRAIAGFSRYPAFQAWKVKPPEHYAKRNGLRWNGIFWNDNANLCVSF